MRPAGGQFVDGTRGVHTDGDLVGSGAETRMGSFAQHGGGGDFMEAGFGCEWMGRQREATDWSALRGLNLAATTLLTSPNPRVLPRRFSATLQPTRELPTASMPECAEDESDGTEADTAATSSFWQSAFNGINLLCGVGVLSLPYAFKQSGWAVGLALLLFICAITNYTGRLIGKCMALDSRIHTVS